MPIQEKIIRLIERALKASGIPAEAIAGLSSIALDHPTTPKFGDYSSNIAMVLAKTVGKKPLPIAETIAEAIRAEFAVTAASAKSVGKNPIEKVEVAPPGFTNFFLSPAFFNESIADILQKTAEYGKNTKLDKQKVVIEYTDPNAFKPLHIGHLMSNAIGESLSRLLQYEKAELRRLTYGSDVGLNVAMAVWGMMQLKTHAGMPAPTAPLAEKIDFIAKAYVLGAKKYAEDAAKDPAAGTPDGPIRKEIHELNRKIYTHSDEAVNEFYVFGKAASIEHFNNMYELLGSRFDHQIFESDIAAFGEEIVKKALTGGIFEKSDGAIIYPGEKKDKEGDPEKKRGLHNRVFITSHGIPTYEAKELGLTKKKFELHDFDLSIVITANEQNDYFKVVTAALTEIYPEIAARTRHIGHGLLRFAADTPGGSSKMSSRTGNVITGEALLAELTEKAMAKMTAHAEAAENSEHAVSKGAKETVSETERKAIAEKVAVAAFKYAVLKQSIGRDVVFDPEQSISFEGDSGPYLQYTYVRTKALLAKAKRAGIESSVDALAHLPKGAEPLQRLLYRFPETIERAAADYAPQYVATYLTMVAAEFNHWYAGEKIIDPADKTGSSAKIALAEAAGWILKNGMWLLGIEAPERM